MTNKVTSSSPMEDESFAAATAATGGASGDDDDDGNTTATTTTTTTVVADRTTANDMSSSNSNNSSSNSNSNNSSSNRSTTYLGIDFGTSNSAVAIWDSFRGHPKWIRLGRHDLAASTSSSSSSSSKAGRIIPSAVLFVSKKAAVDAAAATTAAAFPDLHYYADVASILGRNDVVAYVGAAAMKIVEQAFEHSEKTNEASSLLLFPYSPEQVSRALVTSVKRILGMKNKKTTHCDNTKDDDDMDAVDDDNNDKDAWIQSLPFELVMNVDNKNNNSMKDKSDDNDNNTSCAVVSIRVYPLGMTNDIIVTPEQVVAIILKSIRLAAQEYLENNIIKKKLQVPTRTGSLSSLVRGGVSLQCTNCVIGVPAHFGQTERQTLLRAAHMAGFGGVGDDDNSSNINNDNNNNNNNNHNTGSTNGMELQQQQGAAKVVVSVLTESTAAAMAYGLFVSGGGTGGGEAKRRNDDSNNDDNGTTSLTTTSSILVFDMGGGTTDVTIAEMTSSTSATNNNNNDDDYDDDDSLLPRFQVKVTHGDSHLGGDDMDEALLLTVLTKLVKLEDGHATATSNMSLSTTLLSPSEHRSLLRQCRSAKERLCGDVDHGLTKPEECVTITISTSALTGKKRSIDITQQDLTQALEPILQRAEAVVQTALNRYAALLMLPSSSSSCEESKAETASAVAETDKRRRRLISEVVLVGGATRVLGVRDMLQRLFPPPPDLCLSVNAMSAVAQGTAIKAAMDSNCIPLHELRSAMMLDTTPHAIGVLLDNNNKDETSTTTTTTRFVEIIPRDDPLPASGVATFQLADARQPGISLRAVEEVVEHETIEAGGTGSQGRRRRRLIYPKLGDFAFLLHRLSEQQIAALKDGIRSVDIYMTLKENGELVVSFFDDNDPEHVAKKKRQKQQQQQKKRRSKRDIINASSTSANAAKKKAVLEYYDGNTNDMNDTLDDDKGSGFSKEQWILIGYCIVLMVLYVTAKLVFREELKRFKEE